MDSKDSVKQLLEDCMNGIESDLEIHNRLDKLTGSFNTEKIELLINDVRGRIVKMQILMEENPYYKAEMTKKNNDNSSRIILAQNLYYDLISLKKQSIIKMNEARRIEWENTPPNLSAFDNAIWHLKTLNMCLESDIEHGYNYTGEYKDAFQHWDRVDEGNRYRNSTMCYGYLDDAKYNIRQMVEVERNYDIIDGIVEDITEVTDRFYKFYNKNKLDLLHVKNIGKNGWIVFELEGRFAAELNALKTKLLKIKNKQKEEAKNEDDNEYLIKPKIRAKHYVLTYYFECNAKGETLPVGEKKVLERIGNERIGLNKGNRFYKVFNEIIKKDLNAKKDLIEIGGENWREIILNLTKNRDLVEKYLKDKRL